MARDILIVDDEADIRNLIGGILQDEGYETRMAGDSEGALRETIEEAGARVEMQDLFSMLMQTARLPPSPTVSRVWSSSTSGCRAAGLMDSRCSTKSRHAIRIYRS